MYERSISVSLRTMNKGDEHDAHPLLVVCLNLSDARYFLLRQFSIPNDFFYRLTGGYHHSSNL